MKQKAIAEEKEAQEFQAKRLEARKTSESEYNSIKSILFLGNGKLKKTIKYDSIQTIARKLSQPPKSAFETVETYLANRSQEIGRRVLFCLPLKFGEDELTYDPALGTFEINIPIHLGSTTGRSASAGSYIGSNAFGVKKTIFKESSTRLVVSVGVGSLKQVETLGGAPSYSAEEKSLITMWDGVIHKTDESRWQTELECRISIKCPPEEAPKRKGSFLVIYTGMPVFGTVETQRSSPTIDIPLDVMTSQSLVALDKVTTCIFLVDKMSGDVLREIRFLLPDKL